MPSALMLGSSALLGLCRSIVSVADFSKLFVLVREVSAPGICDFLMLVLISVDRSVMRVLGYSNLNSPLLIFKHPICKLILTVLTFCFAASEMTVSTMRFMSART